MARIPSGHNLDAFNDILRRGFETPEGEGFTILCKNHKLSSQRLGYPETVRQLRLRLQRCHPISRETLSKSLGNVGLGRDQTAFHWLVDIIRKHRPGRRTHGSGGNNRQRDSAWADVVLFHSV